MSARREKRRAANGTEKWYWIVDFVFRHPDGRTERVRQYSPVNNRSGAEEYERRLRQNLLNDSGCEIQAPFEPPTISIFSKEFIDRHARLENRPSEIHKKELTFKNHLCPFFGQMRLDRVGPKHVASYKSVKIADGLSAKTINNHLTMLRTMLRIAAEWQLIETAPIIKLLKVPLPEFDFLDHPETSRLIAAAESDRLWYTMIVTALNTGLRIGELIPLRWSDVDLVTRRIRTLRADWQGEESLPKSGKPRVVPLNEAAWSTLNGYKSSVQKLVFSREAGVKMTYRACNYALEQVCKRAGLRMVGWHTLRHTFASHLAMAGVPLKAIQELLGHASMDMTLRYAHLSPETREKAVDALMPKWGAKPEVAWHTNGTSAGPREKNQ